jgi:hypothetical protein
MEKYITPALLLSLIIIFLYYLKELYTFEDTETYCNQHENETHALLAPNIPDDPQTTYRIGGKYCRPLREHNIVPEHGKYEFVKQQLEYDGVWKSNRKITDETENQTWTTKCVKPIEGTYATNKFFHVPEKVMIPGCTRDDNVYVPDRLEIKDRNMYNFDQCDFDKRKGHVRDIVYWKSGLKD